jgi:hypothetical protein
MLTVLLVLTVLGQLALGEEVGPHALGVGLMVAAAGGLFLTGVLFGARGYVAAAVPWIGFFLVLAPLIVVGVADGPWTSDAQGGLVPLFLSLYAAGLVAAGHAVRRLWLGARRWPGGMSGSEGPGSPWRHSARRD